MAKKKVIKLTTKQQLIKELNSQTQRGITLPSLLTEIAKLIYKYSSTTNRISGGDLIRLRSSVSQFRREQVSIKEILTAILPKSKHFKEEWINEMKQIIKENDVL